MQQLTRMALVGVIALLLLGTLVAVLGSSAYQAISASLILTPTATYCPVSTPEPFWVDPVTSPTTLLSQNIQVYLGFCEAVTVTAESGTFTPASIAGCYPRPVSVKVQLLPSTTHHLKVSGKVNTIEHSGCVYGGYTLSTMRDRFGQPLIITQVFTMASSSHFPIIELRERH